MKRVSKVRAEFLASRYFMVDGYQPFTIRSSMLRNCCES